jgi:hypothetical protein
MTQPPRSRGAPPGNRNALKHALYAKHYSPEISATLLKWDAKDLLGEVHLLRATLNKLAETMLLHDEISAAERTAMSNAISKASSTVNTLVRSYLLLNTTRDPVYLAWEDVTLERVFFIDGETPE